MRRWAIIAITLAVALVMIRRASSGFPLWPGVALPVVLFFAGVAVAAIRRGVPGVQVIAQLLDHDLALREQVSSALEADRGHSPLEDRLQSRAELLVEQARQNWVLRPARDGAEWAALACLVAALVLVSVAPAPAPSPAPVATRPVALAPPPSHSPPIHVAVGQAPVENSPPPTLPPAPVGQRPSSVRTSTQNPNGTTPHSSGKAHKKSTNRSAPGVPGPPASIYSRGGGGSRATHGQQIQGHASFQHGHVASPGQQTRRGGTPLGSSSSPNGGHGLGGSTSKSSASGKTGSGKNAKASGRQGAAGKTKSSPYGGNPGISKAVSKPGLITGPALNASSHAPGSTAGKGQGSKGGKPAAQRSTQLGQGKQLTLKSPYTGSSSGKQRSAAGSSGQQSGKTARSQGGTSPTGGTDYIPPDSNTSSPSDTSIIVRYFGSSGR